MNECMARKIDFLQNIHHSSWQLVGVIPIENCFSHGQCKYNVIFGTIEYGTICVLSSLNMKTINRLLFPPFTIHSIVSLWIINAPYKQFIQQFFPAVANSWIYRYPFVVYFHLCRLLPPFIHPFMQFPFLQVSNRVLTDKMRLATTQTWKSIVRRLLTSSHVTISISLWAKLWFEAMNW